MGPFGSLRGHHSLQTASEVKSDLRFEISDPKYLHSHEYIASNEPFCFWGPYNLQTAAEVKSYLIF